MKIKIFANHSCEFDKSTNVAPFVTRFLAFTFTRKQVFDVSTETLRCSKCGRWLSAPKAYYSEIYNLVNVSCAMIIAALAYYWIEIYLRSLILAVAFMITANFAINRVISSVVLTYFSWVIEKVDDSETEHFIKNKKEQRNARKQKHIRMIIAGSFAAWKGSQVGGMYIMLVAILMLEVLLIGGATGKKRWIKVACLALLFLVLADFFRHLFDFVGLKFVLDVISLGFFAYFLAICMNEE